MGLFDKVAKVLGLGGSEQQSSQQTSGESTQKQTSTGTTRSATDIFSQALSDVLTAQTQTGRTTGTTAGTRAETTSGAQQQQATTLDAETQALLRSLIQGAGGAIQTGALTNLITERAIGADATAANQTQAIVEAARQNVQRELGQTEQRLAGEAGSSLNSLVQQLGLQGRTEAETALAGLEAQLNREARQAATAELTGAAQLGTSQIAALVDALKGATTTTAGTTTGTATGQTTEQAITDILQQLTGTQTTQTTESQQQTTEQLVQTIVDALTKQQGTVAGQTTGFNDPFTQIISGSIGKLIGK